MSARILLVEDEALVSDLVRLNLEHAGYAVEAVDSGTAAIDRLEKNPYDLVLLDVMLPGADGYTVARRARQMKVMTPILMLTARGETPAKVEGFEAGADDYLTKPFAMPELLARVKALIRRHTTPRGIPTSRELAFGKYHVNFDTREAVTNEGKVTLTERECALLEYLAGREGQLIDRAELLEEVWGMDRFPTARTVDNYILRLRKLLEPDPEEPIYLQTVRGRGYRFVRS